LHRSKCGGHDPTAQVQDLGPAVNPSITMNNHQSLDDVVLCHVRDNVVIPVPCLLGVTGPFQVMQATGCIPGKVIHIPWSNEVLKDDPVTYVSCKPMWVWGGS
jgi:hypothetical protein